MLVIGIDPGTVKLGYGVLSLHDRGEVRYVECGVLSCPAGWNKWRRMRMIGDELHTVLVEVGAQHGDVAGIEAGYIGPNMSGVLSLGEARGMVGFVLSDFHVDIHEVAPSTVKKNVTGSGKANKAEVAEMVRRQLKLNRAPDPDAADALGVAMSVAHHGAHA